MENTISDILSCYKEQYAKTFPIPRRRLPVALVSEQDTMCRLQALQELYVESRGRQFILDDSTKENIRKVASWLMNSKKRGLLLMGTLGNGKTTMLNSIFRLFGNCKATIGNAQDIFDHFKTTQGSMKYWDEDLLLIDDLGIEPPRCMTFGEENYPLSKLLLHRYDRCLTTVIATNLDLAQLEDRYGDRVTDRLFETFELIVYNNASYRRI